MKGSNYDYKRSTFYFNGKQYGATGRTQKEADQKAAIKKKALDNGEIGISKNMTVSAWCAEWLETYKVGNIANKSLATYKRHIRMITDEVGNVKLKDVRDVHLQRILKSRQGFSTSDTSKLRYTIMAIFMQARISRLIPYDPAEDLEMPRTTQGKRRSITDIEREWILRTAETHHAGLWIKMMLYCGLRPQEIIALQWKDVDLKKKLVYIDKAKESGSNEIKDPKTDAGNREIPIPDILVDYLKRAKGEPFRPVYTQLTTDKRHTESSFYCAWHNFVREMDIANGAKVYRNEIIMSVIASDLEPYCLRHTYCTDLEAAGVPINVARYLMGHADISVTSKIYTHTTGKVISDAADKINQNINSNNVKNNVKSFSKVRKALV